MNTTQKSSVKCWYWTKCIVSHLKNDSDFSVYSQWRQHYCYMHTCGSLAAAYLYCATNITEIHTDIMVVPCVRGIVKIRGGRRGSMLCEASKLNEQYVADMQWNWQNTCFWYSLKIHTYFSGFCCYKMAS